MTKINKNNNVRANALHLLKVILLNNELDDIMKLQMFGLIAMLGVWTRT